MVNRRGGLAREFGALPQSSVKVLKMCDENKTAPRISRKQLNLGLAQAVTVLSVPILASTE